VEGIREILGGGSPNSVTAYINEWYRELGSRLAAAETPLAGFPPEAVSLMTELWRLAATDQAKTRDSDAADDTATRMLAAERDALEAEAKALQTLNQELQRHRSTAEKSLAEARALLSRREAALEEERSRAASLEQALVQARMEVEVLLERRRLTPPHTPVPGPSRKVKRRKRPAARALTAKRRTGAKQSSSRKPAKRARRLKRPRNR
jgi:chromosome segregation ATPase